MPRLHEPPVQLDMFSRFGVPQTAPFVPAAPQENRLMFFPNVDAKTRSQEAVKLGLSGELLTHSELARHGFAAVQPVGMAFDFLVYWPFFNWRVQVKTISAPRNGFYSTSIQQGYRNSPQGRRAYQRGAFDVLAVPLLDINTVIFTTGFADTIRIPVEAARFAQQNPGNSLLTAFGELLANPEFGDLPDRAEVIAKFHADWQRSLRRMKQDVAEGQDEPVAAFPEIGPP